MRYTIKIGDIILQDMENNDIISEFMYKLNSIQDERSERDPDARSEFTVSGKITFENCNTLKKVLEWSLTKENVYRELEVKIINESNDKEKACRILKFDKVFCIDYEEKYNQSDSETIFTLKMAQSPNGKRHEVDCEYNDED